MQKIVNKVLKIFTWILVFLAVLLAILLVGIRIFGLRVYTVLSPSMAPHYPTGSIIYVQEVDPHSLKVNDVITFLLSDNTSATHRIVDILPSESDPQTLYFQTKGDANDTEDASPVHEANVVGKPVFVIPYLGYIANFIQNPPGMYLSISGGLILIIFVFMVDMLTQAQKSEDQASPESGKQ